MSAIAALPLIVSQFPTAMPTAKEALGDMEQKTWGDLRDMLSVRREGQKDGPNLVFARFKLEAKQPHGQTSKQSVRRLKVNVEARTAIALDVDGNKETGEVAPALRDISQRITAQGWAALLYTSHSHSAKAPRYRIVLPLNAEIPPHLPAVEAVADILGLSGVLDKSKLGASSVFYLPSSEPGKRADHHAGEIEGRAIDAEWITDRASDILAERDRVQAEIRAAAMAESERRRAAKIKAGFKPTEKLIEAIRDRLDLAGELLRHGYVQQGDRYLYSGSETGIPGVHVLRGNDGVERVFSHHSGDPLAAGNLPAWCSVKAVDAVDVVAILDFGGDFTKALRELGTRFGIGEPLKAKAPPEEPPGFADVPPHDDAGHRQGESFTIEEVAPVRPVLDVVPGEIDRLATAAEAALRDSGLPIFQRGASIVIPVSHDVPAAHGRMTVAAGLKDLAAAGMIDHMAQAACFRHWNQRKNKMVPCNPPALAASVILSRSGQWTLPSIAGVITTPTLRPDGSLLTAPGYDPATRFYHVPDPALRLPHMIERPTRADAEAGIELLGQLLTEFGFVAPVDRAVALSALMTPVLRGMIPAAPLHGIRASTAGSGKTFLVDLASAIATARPCPVLAAGEKDEETEKRLVGALLAAYPIVSIDNCNGELGGDLLNQAIEHPLVRLRALGNSDTIEVECCATFFATGNGLRVRGDMTRRTIICSLDAGVERPELREFKQDPLQRILADRGAYVAAVLTIARAYLCAGQPDRIRPVVASFPDWSNTVRSALVWLKQPDPVETMEKAREDDPELTELRQVIGAWHYHFGDAPSTARSVADHAFGSDMESSHPGLRDALMAVAGERGGINCKRLGRWLLKHEGRIVRVKKDDQTPGQELRFKRHGIIAGIVCWKVV